MAKNTSSSAFRRVDVDQYIEGKYEEDALTDDGVNGPNDMEIQTMLAQYPLIHDLLFLPISTIESRMS